MHVIGVIPARYASTRLPGKALREIGGKTMIQRVYERCADARALDALYVATDDGRILQAVQAFGGRAVMTSPDHASGTDRIAEAVQSLPADIVVNIQGDQPFLDPVMIEEVVQPFLAEPRLQMATLRHRIDEAEDLHDPAVVKVVVDLDGFALYFSRARIPYPQKNVPHDVYEHVGLYAYRRDFLLKIAQSLPTTLERVESLEQLRVLQYGHRIRVVETRCLDHALSGFSVDTPQDLERAERMLRDRGLP
jgi:3-deoxy-manno-octulosonate cytidylyltransferase (CMP-KDO synthetase)